MAIVTYKSSTGTRTVTESNAQVFKGFSTQQGEFKSAKLYDIELVKQDLFNHFNIRKGEKLENPDFGTNIWQYIFDPLDIDTKNAIIRDIESVVNYDPRVALDQIEVNEYEHGVQVDVLLIYIGYGIKERLNLLFDQNQGLMVGGSTVSATT
jgi:phage baseplate assembly protein W